MESTRTRTALSRLLLAGLTLAVAALLSFGALSGCAQQQGDSAQSASEPTPTTSSTADAITVEVTILSTLPDHEIDKSLAVDVPAGGSAYDALMASGSDVQGDGGFVKSIDGLENGAAGSMSGWTYLVNGEEPTIGASSYELQSGDVVEWIYSVGE